MTKKSKVAFYCLISTIAIILLDTQDVSTPVATIVSFIMIANLLAIVMEKE